MKYLVLSPIRNNGKLYPVNSVIELSKVPANLEDHLEVIPYQNKVEMKSAAKKKAAPKKKTISKK